MGKIHVLKSIQRIPAPVEKVWDFFSNPSNLKLVTPPFLNLQTTNEVYGTGTYPGQVMTYVVKPFLNIGLEWMTEITHVEKPQRFVDEQRKGPYKLWHHQHHFKEIAGGVEMTDLVHYRLPLGVLGNIAHPIAVKPRLIKIFEYRFEAIEKIFGSWPGTSVQLEID